jgi:hypothetical protein
MLNTNLHTTDYADVSKGSSQIVARSRKLIDLLDSHSPFPRVSENILIASCHLGQMPPKHEHRVDQINAGNRA